MFLSKLVRICKNIETISILIAHCFFRGRFFFQYFHFVAARIK